MARPKKDGRNELNQEELLNKLAQIEEQAKCTLDEFPITLTKERLRMIIALCKYLRAEISQSISY